MSLLCAWASRGPNDALGQELLAEALRLAPASREAQQAFERMEGLGGPPAAGQHKELDAALARFDEAELERLERELKGPMFRRAQIGFNNNIKAKGQVFHIQTEDSGLSAPHVVTHLFADGGRIIKSYKRSYAAAVNTEDDIGGYVRKLMKAQHLEMVIALRDGRFDDVLAGRAMGGLEVRADFPQVDASEHGGRARRTATDGGQGTAETTVTPAETAAAAPEPSPTQSPRSSMPSLFTLHVVRSLSGGPGRYAVSKVESVLGTSAPISLEGERFCAPQHAELKFGAGRLWITPLDPQNGVFVRIHQPTLLRFGEDFMVGDQLLRVMDNPRSDDSPDPGPTYFYSSPRWQSAFRVVQVLEGGALGACLVARGSSLQVGAVMGDFILGEDPLVDAQHCVLEEHAGALLLTDLGSRTGVFVRVRETEELVSGDELVIGRTHLVVAIEGSPTLS